MLRVRIQGFGVQGLSFGFQGLGFPLLLELTEFPLCFEGNRISLSDRMRQSIARVCEIILANLAIYDRLRVGNSLGLVPREPEMLKGHLPRVIYRQLYKYTKIITLDVDEAGAKKWHRLVLDCLMTHLVQDEAAYRGSLRDTPSKSSRSEPNPNLNS